MPRKAKTATSSDLPSWVDSRQEQGLYFFTREDAIESLQFTEEAFKKAAARLAKKNRILRIRSGFFIIVPLEYRTTGILPAGEAERDTRWRLLINTDVDGDL